MGVCVYRYLCTSQELYTLLAGFWCVLRWAAAAAVISADVDIVTVSHDLHSSVQ